MKKYNMPAHFNESKLQSSYHALWEQFYARWHGAKFDVYVPGKEEVYVGFDVGFARSRRNFKLTSYEFFEWMKWRVNNQSVSETAFLYAYFLQYKLLQEVALLKNVKCKTTKTQLVKSFGYSLDHGAFRAKLDTTRKPYAKGVKKHVFSQHEALCRLASIREADVAYCLPRYTSQAAIPSINSRSLTDLMRVQVSESTPRLRDQDSHYLYFKSTNGTSPAWCSDPVLASIDNEPVRRELLTPTQFLQLMKANYLVLNSDLANDLTTIDKVEINYADLEFENFSLYFQALPSCTRLMAFRMSAQ